MFFLKGTLWAIFQNCIFNWNFHNNCPFTYLKHSALFEPWARRRLGPFPTCSPCFSVSKKTKCLLWLSYIFTWNTELNDMEGLPWVLKFSTKPHQSIFAWRTFHFLSVSRGDVPVLLRHEQYGFWHQKREEGRWLDLLWFQVTCTSPLEEEAGRTASFCSRGCSSCKASSPRLTPKDPRKR